MESTKGMRAGTGASPGKKIEPFRERNGQGQSFKTIGQRAVKDDSGAAIDRWCRGKSKDYK